MIGRKKPDARIKQVRRSRSIAGIVRHSRTRSTLEVRSWFTASFSDDEDATLWPAECKSRERFRSRKGSKPTESTRMRGIDTSNFREQLGASHVRVWSNFCPDGLSLLTDRIDSDVDCRRDLMTITTTGCRYHAGRRNRAFHRARCFNSTHRYSQVISTSGQQFGFHNNAP